jgi:decaprenylphospho-beta-D-ribofuranose 2-oxidase
MERKYKSIDLYSKETCGYLSYDFSEKDKRKILDDNYSIKGSGTSIVGSYFSKSVKVIETYSSQEIISFDSSNKEIIVRPSMRLSKLYDFLIPHHLFIGSVPSYPSASIGGCIAANVHGQNHIKEGCFSNNILSIKIYHPDKGLLECSSSKNNNLFDLTIGGYGCTGVIQEVKLRLIELKTNLLDIKTITFSSLIEGFELIEKESNNFDYIHSWCDMTLASSHKQKGFIQLARFASGDIIQNTLIDKKVKNNHMAILINIFGTKLIIIVNKLYFLINTYKTERKVFLHNFIFPSRTNLFYFSMFGKKGIIEHQVLIPKETAKKYLLALMDIVEKKAPIISLCHLKVFKGNSKFIRFDGFGYVLAFHIYNDDNGLNTLKEIDKINLSYGCKVNLIKDSRLKSKSIHKQYKEIEKFKSEVLKFDHNLKFSNNIIDKIFNKNE